MSKYYHIILQPAAALLLGLAALPAANAQAAKNVNVVNTPNVHVTNTPSVAVVNTPSVNVANTPTVNVGNTASVNVANTPNVTVTNTAAQPVFVTSINDAGRIPYQSTVDNSNKCSGSTCVWNFTPPMAGHRIVIQHISGMVNFDATPGAVAVQLNNGSGAFLSSFFAPVNGNVLLSTFDQPVQAYIDPTQIIQLEVLVFGANFFGSNTTQIITMSGYELDCNAAPCAPIAH